MSRPEERELDFDAPALIESLRDMGYSLKTALADIVDNSITAGASNIELFADTHGEKPLISVLDDGCGMSKRELIRAMKLGSRSPLDVREEHDLGRFGLGLKTASFSQCRRFTVVTRKNGSLTSATWDHQTVTKRGKLVIELPTQAELIRNGWQEKLAGNGTLVVWENLDRLVRTNAESERRDLVDQLDQAATHLEFVFHRFLADRGGNKVRMSLNGRKLEAFDPFNSNHAATQHHPQELISLGGDVIRISPYTLPHHDKVSKEDWDRFAGQEGYVRNQGFYLYRNRRLILHGTWFRLARQLELTKLARVGIDIPNTLDADWKIDVRKASAQPPLTVRNRLKKIIEKIGEPSRRTYTKRGAKLTTESRLPFWVRTQDKNRISYHINDEHPLISGLASAFEKEKQDELKRILKMIAIALPVDALHVDVSGSPANSVQQSVISDDDLESISRSLWQMLRDRNMSSEEIKNQMVLSPPFDKNWERTLTIIDSLTTEDSTTE